MRVSERTRKEEKKKGKERKAAEKVCDLWEWPEAFYRFAAPEERVKRDDHC
jgi:hypothetical protein